MRPVNDRLRDLLLRRAVRRGRMENACVRDVAAEWNAMRDEILTVIAASGVITGVRTSRAAPSNWALDQALSSVLLVMRNRMSKILRCLDGDLPMLARLELTEMPSQVETAINQSVAQTLGEARARVTPAPPPPPTPRVNVAFNQVPIAQAAQLIASPLGGTQHAQAFADLGQDTLRSLRTTLVNGLLQGQSVPQATRAVRNVLNNRRSAAERIVRSEYVRVGNEAALLSYERNQDVLSGVQWLATLDRRTCPVCAVYDGKVWRDMRQAKMPVSDTHPLCRCTLIPVVKDYKALGLTRTEGTRSSFNGQVSGKLNYQEWFGQQDDAFQREVLGPARYNLYKSGKATLRDFAGTHGTKSVAQVLRDLETKGMAPLDLPEPEPAVPAVPEAPEFVRNIRALQKAGIKDDRDVIKIGQIVREEMLSRQDAYKVRIWGEIERAKAEVEKVRLTIPRVPPLNDPKAQAIFDKKFDAYKGELMKAQDKVKALQEQVRSTRTIARETLAEVREMGGVPLDFRSSLRSTEQKVANRRAEQALYDQVSEAANHLPADWLRASKTRGNLQVIEAPRAYYEDANVWKTAEQRARPEKPGQGGGLIALSGTDRADRFSAAIHELGHRMEASVPKILDMEAKFYARRTAGEPLQHLGGGYVKEEVARFDKFSEAYMGKDYSRPGRAADAYELLSMGHEVVFGTRGHLAAKDPEFVDFILGILAGV